MEKYEDAYIESNKSEVARIRRQIALVMQACERVFNDPSITAPHDFITKRMEEIGHYKDELVSLVGTQEAARLTILAMEEGG